MTKQKVKTEQLTTLMKTPWEQGLTMKETLKCPQEGVTGMGGDYARQWQTATRKLLSYSQHCG